MVCDRAILPRRWCPPLSDEYVEKLVWLGGEYAPDQVACMFNILVLEMRFQGLGGCE